MSNAVYALNAYLWKLLESNLGWDKEDYDGATPIIPTADQPEFQKTGRPYIVYGYSQDKSGHLYALEYGTVAYYVFSETYTEANRVTDVIFKVLQRGDDAATDVNDWIDIERDNDKIRGVSFGTVCAVSSVEADPSRSEDGYTYAGVIVKVSFVDHEEFQTSGFEFP
jgi:hypothetical protein